MTKCFVIAKADSGEPCEAEATKVVYLPGGDEQPVCDECYRVATRLLFMILQLSDEMVV